MPSGQPGRATNRGSAIGTRERATDDSLSTTSPDCSRAAPAPTAQCHRHRPQRRPQRHQRRRRQQRHRHRDCATDNPVPSAAPSPPPPAAPPAATAAAPAAAPPPSVLPAEAEMSAADRRQVQEALHRLDYYKGPVDGIFGPLTRAAIRRFQQDIGSDATGYLTADQANRLVTPR